MDNTSYGYNEIHIQRLEWGLEICGQSIRVGAYIGFPHWKCIEIIALSNWTKLARKWIIKKLFQILYTSTSLKTIYYARAWNDSCLSAIFQYLAIYCTFSMGKPVTIYI